MWHKNGLQLYTIECLNFWLFVASLANSFIESISFTEQSSYSGTKSVVGRIGLKIILRWICLLKLHQLVIHERSRLLSRKYSQKLKSFWRERCFSNAKILPKHSNCGFKSCQQNIIHYGFCPPISYIRCDSWESESKNMQQLLDH